MGPNSGSEEQFAGMESSTIRIGDEVRLVTDGGWRQWFKVAALADAGVWVGSTLGGTRQQYAFARFEDVLEVNR